MLPALVPAGSDDCSRKRSARLSWLLISAFFSVFVYYFSRFGLLHSCTQYLLLYHYADLFIVSIKNTEGLSFRPVNSGVQASHRTRTYSPICADDVLRHRKLSVTRHFLASYWTVSLV